MTRHLEDPREDAFWRRRWPVDRVPSANERECRALAWLEYAVSCLPFSARPKGNPPLYRLPCPIEDLAPANLLPDEWFAWDGADKPPSRLARALFLKGGGAGTLSVALASYMAGYPNRPDESEMLEAIRARRHTRRQKRILYSFFLSIDPFEASRIALEHGLAMRELARAVRAGGCRRNAALTHWLHRFARPPSRTRGEPAHSP